MADRAVRRVRSPCGPRSGPSRSSTSSSRCSGGCNPTGASRAWTSRCSTRTAATSAASSWPTAAPSSAPRCRTTRSSARVVDASLIVDNIGVVPAASARAWPRWPVRRGGRQAWLARRPADVARRNRVTPLSELVADPRAAWSTATAAACTTPGQIRRRYAGRRWIACRLRFRGWHRTPLLQPGASPSCSSSTRRRRWPPGTARARCAGARTTTAWSRCGATLHPGQVGADAMDAQLHGERVAAGTRAQRHHEAPLDDLPDAHLRPARRRAVARARRRAAGLDAGGLRRARRAARARARAWSSRRPRWSRSCARAGSRCVPLLHPSARA